ncbi:MAG: hypothetical protein OSA84_07575 [Akkermansiaceae bacterium]|nr:hypothetical protein [Akkermansiaceae bacterium]
MKFCFATLSIAAGLTVAALGQASNFHLRKAHEKQPGEVILHQSVSDSQSSNDLQDHRDHRRRTYRRAHIKN